MKRILTVLAGALAGLINGFLGTGGGVVLVLVQGALFKQQETKDRLATAVLSIMPMSAVSAYLYSRSDGFDLSASAPYLLAALFGGAFGSWLLGRLSPASLKVLFALLMLWAGWRMAFG